MFFETFLILSFFVKLVKNYDTKFFLLILDNKNLKW